MLIVSHTGWNKFVRTDCDYTWLFNSITFYYTWSMLFFFSNFYYQTYVSRKRRSIRVTTGTAAPTQELNGITPAHELNGIKGSSGTGGVREMNGSVAGEEMGGKVGAHKEEGYNGVRSRKVVEANGK